MTSTRNGPAAGSSPVNEYTPVAVVVRVPTRVPVLSNRETTAPVNPVSVASLMPSPFRSSQTTPLISSAAAGGASATEGASGAASATLVSWNMGSGADWAMTRPASIVAANLRSRVPVNFAGFAMTAAYPCCA